MRVLAQSSYESCTSYNQRAIRARVSTGNYSTGKIFEHYLSLVLACVRVCVCGVIKLLECSSNHICDRLRSFHCIIYIFRYISELILYFSF